ncbi:MULTISPECIES: hypothetical protein [Halomonas]|uniref:Uncharacterized protein n=1 Tax=Halomonas icarae TaxID=2691040 RepID=A0A7X4VWK7_9GAMM|nr:MULTISPECIES: hypothetical protein [Halomonas]MDR5903476.1 hypothetical protein [Halomonas icarae]MDT0500378.1 hypothetical protein [Halomonas sp. PAR7]MDT0511125.1 hypothetical protein [Halomonas sp. LES1]MDT0593146.1 hypothetical protein [Halomonas sp. PAR8]NAW11677.1 hypothetical protein [Halomonas icarae]
MGYDFDSLDTTDRPNMGGGELNFYTEWLLSDETSFYAQLLVGGFF